MIQSDYHAATAAHLRAGVCDAARWYGNRREIKNSCGYELAMMKVTSYETFEYMCYSLYYSDDPLN